MNTIGKIAINNRTKDCSSGIGNRTKVRVDFIIEQTLLLFSFSQSQEIKADGKIA